MGLIFESDILPETSGLMLCKIVGDDDLRLSEGVIFERGRPAVLTVLNRASITGHVGGGLDRETDYWADQLDATGSYIGEIKLDRDSWNALKNRLLRCAMQPLL